MSGSWPRYDGPPLLGKVPPRCPPFLEDDITTVEELMPYLEAVARRPYNHGLHAGWDLQRGERVLLRVDNWHSPLVIEACKRILERYECDYEVLFVDKGPIPVWEGHDEVEYYLARTKELAEWMDTWEAMEAEGRWDKLLWGYGGPVLSDARIKIQRMPFITPELLASPAHTMPYEVLEALDLWTWDRVRRAARIRITDPEGTDLNFTNHDGYYDPTRSHYDLGLVGETWKGNTKFGRTYLPGHVTGRPWLYLPQEESHGVVAGTSNHIGVVPWTRLHVENSRITAIDEGGEYGDKLRALMDRTSDLQYPGVPGSGLMRWWEASIGTNPHIHRPRKNFQTGWLNCLYERMRSGVIHIGFGTIISSAQEREAAKLGLPVGHWHLHLYFPTFTCEMPDGSTETVIRDGHLLGLDDPDVRELAARHGDPDQLLAESWIPAVPGINVKGDYGTHYAQDPKSWVMTELEVCRRWHHLFMDMVGADADHCHGSERLWRPASSASSCSAH